MKFAGDKALKADVAKLDTSKVPDDITEINDVSYIDDNLPGHMLDVYLHKDGTKKPILIDIHGGGFISEDKAMNRLFGCYMARQGFAVFEMNFRLAYPQYNFFDQVKDIDCGVRYVTEHADEFECDRDQIYIAGHSSGGVLAACECLLSVDPVMRSDFGIGERDYSYKGFLVDCGLMHFYKSSIAYWGMRKMVFPKGYKNDKRYQYLLFDRNESINSLPRVALITNSKDVLRKMTYHFEGILNSRQHEHKLFVGTPDGHTGIIFVPYTDSNLLTLAEVTSYLMV